MEHDFLDSQIGAAQLNQFKLDNRQEELSENIVTLRAEIEAQETERLQKKAESLKQMNSVGHESNKQTLSIHQPYGNVVNDQFASNTSQLSSNVGDEAYFQQVAKNFSSFKSYLRKKNDAIRTQNQRKEL